MQQPMSPAALAKEKRRFETICRQNPGNFHAWWNLGRINLELGHHPQALQAFDQALAFKPAHIEVLIGKLLACLRLNRLEDALTTVERAQAAAPGNSDVLLHKGDVLHRLRRNGEALAVYEQILAVPRLSRQKRLYALSAKVVILIKLGRHQDALETAAHGLDLAPDDPTLLSNEAALLVRLGRSQEALAALDALASTGSAMSFAARANRVQALAALRRFDEADVLLNELRQRNSDEQLQRVFFQGRREVSDAVSKRHTARGLYLTGFFKALEECDWRNYETTLADFESLTAEARTHGNDPGVDPFQLLSLPIDPDLQFALTKARARYISRCMAPQRDQLQLTHSIRRDGERLRIGYVSGDFRDHPTAHLMRKLFRVHDRNRFEIIGYSLRPGDDSIYWKDIAETCDDYVELTELTNIEAAQRIARNRVHILVDLHCYTQYARPEIFALRPAPLQVSYLGYPGTSGADFIDYIIADRVVLPEEPLHYYTEQPVYLPDCYQVNNNSQPIAETGVSRAEQNLPEDAFVYCCFNTSYKIEPVSFAVWMQILKQAPGSVLWLLAKDQQMVKNLRRAADDHGVEPQRLIFAQRLPKPEHLERCRLADLFLDTFIYNAHTTASDALWAGLPVLTLCGEVFPSRVCASLLAAVGLPELVTYNSRDFTSLAVELAENRQKLAAIRSRLQANRLEHPLFDTERFAHHLERAFEKMWEVNEAVAKPHALYI